MKTVNFDNVCHELVKAQQDAIRLKHRIMDIENLLKDCVSGPEYMLLWKTVRDIKTIQQRINELHSNYGPF